MYNIANVGWQLVHYIVYETQKSDNGLGFASSIIAFLRPVNCIVDSPPSNICIICTRYAECGIEGNTDRSKVLSFICLYAHGMRNAVYRGQH